MYDKHLIFLVCFGIFWFLNCLRKKKLCLQKTFYRVFVFSLLQKNPGKCGMTIFLICKKDIYILFIKEVRPGGGWGKVVSYKLVGVFFEGVLHIHMHASSLSAKGLSYKERSLHEGCFGY